MSLMKPIGAYEAKTNLSHFLDEVSEGASFAITRRGIPIAMLVPYQATEQQDPIAAVQALRQFRKGVTWGKGMNTLKILKAGRR